MKAMTIKYSDVPDRLASAMTRVQALRLKNLAGEAYQPERLRKPAAGSTRSRRRSRWRTRSELGGAFTFRVGLAAPDRDQQAGLGFRDVGHVKSD